MGRPAVVDASASTILHADDRYHDIHARETADISFGARCRRFGGALAILGTLALGSCTSSPHADQANRAHQRPTGIAYFLNGDAPHVDADPELMSARLLTDTSTTRAIPRGSSGTLAMAGTGMPEWLEDAQQWIERNPLDYSRRRLSTITSWIERYPLRALGIGVMGWSLALFLFLRRGRRRAGSARFRSIEWSDLQPGEFFDTGNVLMIKTYNPDEGRIQTIQAGHEQRHILLAFTRKPRHLDQVLNKLFRDPEQRDLARQITERELVQQYGLLRRMSNGKYLLDAREFKPSLARRLWYRIARRKVAPQPSPRRPRQTLRVTAPESSGNTYHINRQPAKPAHNRQASTVAAPSKNEKQQLPETVAGTASDDELPPTVGVKPTSTQETVRGFGASQVTTFEARGEGPQDALPLGKKKS